MKFFIDTANVDEIRKANGEAPSKGGKAKGKKGKVEDEE